jgi:hypothetical protein
MAWRTRDTVAVSRGSSLGVDSSVWTLKCIGVSLHCGNTGEAILDKNRSTDDDNLVDSWWLVLPVIAATTILFLLLSSYTIENEARGSKIIIIIDSIMLAAFNDI